MRPGRRHEVLSPGPRRRRAPRWRARAARRRLRKRQRLALRDADLPAHQVEAGHQLGDRVLDLEPGVHLEEVEVARARRRGTRPCRRRRSPPPSPPCTATSPIVARSSGRAGWARASPRSTFWWRRWREHSRSPRWTQLPWRVGEDLDLDVAGLVEVLLEVHRVVAEARRSPRSAPRARRESKSSARSTRRMPLPPPPAAALSITGKPIFSAKARASSTVGERARCARARPARRPSTMLARARVFSPIASIAVAGGPMKAMPAVSQARTNAGVLGEEAVAGVDRVGARLLARPRGCAPDGR